MAWSVLGFKSNFWILLTNNLKINAHIPRSQILNKQLILFSLLTETALPVDDKNPSIEFTDRNDTAYCENNEKKINY
jgi:hypothetical protein